MSQTTLPAVRLRAIATALVILCGSVWTGAAAMAQNASEPETLSGHDGAVALATFAPDGLAVVSASADHSARLWDLRSGATLRSFDGHTGPLYTLALSGNGRTLVTGAQDNTVRIWDVPQTRPLVTITGDDQAIRALAASADGSLMISGGEDGRPRLWDAAQLQTSLAGGEQAIDPAGIARPLSGHDAPLAAVAVRGDAQAAASADADGRILFWNPYLDEPQGMVRTTPVIALGYLGNSPQLASLGADGRVRIWDSSRPPRQQLKSGGEAVRHFAVARGQPIGVSVTADHVVRVVRLDNDELMHQSGKQPAAVTSLALAPNDALFAIGLADGTARVFDLLSGESRWSLDGHTDAVNGVAFLPDSRQLVTGGVDGALRHWQLADPDAELRSTWDELPAKPVVMATAVLGETILIGGADHQIRQISLADGEVRQSFPGHSAAITCLAVDTVRQRMAGGDADGSLRLWDLKDGSELLAAIDHDGPLSSIEFSPDGTRVVSVTDDGQLRLFLIESGEELERFSDHDPGKAPGAAQVGWLGSDRLVSGSTDAGLQLRYLSAARVFAAHDDEPVDMAIVANDVVTAWGDGRVMRVNTGSGQVTSQYEGLAGRPQALAVRSDGQRLACGTADGAVVIWNTAGGEPLQSLQVDSTVMSLAWSSDNQKLVAATEDSRLLIWGRPLPPQQPQPGSELVLHQQTEAPSPITTVAFSADNRSVRTGDAAGQLAVWSYAAPGPVRQLNHGGPVYSVAISRDGRTILSGSADQTVRVWDAETGGQRAQLRGHEGAVHAVAISPDQSLAVSSGADRTIRLWDIVGGRALKQLAALEDTIYAVAVHPDGRQIAAAGADRNVYLMNLISGTIEATLEGHGDYIHSVAFNPSGSRLASYGYAGELRIWDTAGKKLLWEERVARVGNGVDFDPQGERVLLSAGDGKLRILDIPRQVR